MSVFSQFWGIEVFQYIIEGTTLPIIIKQSVNLQQTSQSESVNTPPPLPSPPMPMEFNREPIWGNWAKLKSKMSLYSWKVTALRSLRISNYDQWSLQIVNYLIQFYLIIIIFIPSFTSIPFVCENTFFPLIFISEIKNIDKQR